MEPLSVAKGVGPALKAVRLVRHIPPVRRWLIGRRLVKLVPGNTLGTFCQVFGEPRSSRRSSDGLVLHQWETPDVTTAAITEWDDVTVLGYRVERANRRFRPHVRLLPDGTDPPFSLHLGKTTFAEVWSQPLKAVGALGASTWEYRELNYLGRPGLYRHYSLVVNDLSLTTEMSEHLRQRKWDCDRGDGGGGGWQAARAVTPVDGYAVYDGDVDVGGWPEQLLI
jgi:hypothetical protein